MSERSSIYFRFPIILTSLFLSGTGSIINQVVWQRALKIFLGGSETLSAVIVVLVFMFGLGFGAIIAGQNIQKFKHPIIVLALIEIVLFVINLIIAWVFTFSGRSPGDRSGSSSPTARIRSGLLS